MLRSTFATVLLFSIVALPAAFAQATSGPVDITAQQLDVQQRKGLAVFSGDVVVTQGGFTLSAPKVTATYGTQGSGDIESIEASGGVVITRPAQGGLTEKATGTTATYTPGKQQVVMSGAVTLIRGPSQLSGDKLTYDLASGNARVTNSNGPVKARFVPNAK